MPRRFLLAFFVGSALLAAGCASGPPPTPVERGEAALAAGDWREARDHFAEALRLDGRSARAWLGRARAELAGRDPEAALRSLARLSKVDRDFFVGNARPTWGEALEAATVDRLARGKSREALASVRALARLEPGRRGLDPLLGRTLIAEADRLRWSGDRKAALALYREAVQVVPETLEAWVGAAEILLESRRGSEAMALLEAARKRHPTAGVIRALTLQAMAMR
ncbi:MAG TPA: tetratricopeptide repeat protein [Deltaproteobacteria bacterium]|nr:tetratricopeptide repeat protein [Deltaproteobacteria bacterium]